LYGGRSLASGLACGRRIVRARVILEPHLRSDGACLRCVIPKQPIRTGRGNREGAAERRCPLALTQQERQLRRLWRGERDGLRESCCGRRRRCEYPRDVAKTRRRLCGLLDRLIWCSWGQG